jgi:hypothetical protein
MLRLFLCLTIVLCPAISDAETPTTQPTLITLHAQSASPKDLFKQLGDQSHTTFLPKESNLFDNLPPTTIDIDAQPFWQATKLLCGKTGLYPVFIDKRKLTLAGTSKGWFDGPTIVSGPFLVLAVQAARSSTLRYRLPDQRHNEMTIQLAILPEPRLRVLKGSKFARLDEASDDKGNSLLPAIPASDAMTTGGPFAWTLECRLDSSSNAKIERIAKLKGHARYAVQTAADTMQVPDILTAANQTRTVNNRIFSVLSCKKNTPEEKNPDCFALHLSIASAAGHPDAESAQLMHPGDLSLVDPNGVPLVFKAWTRQISPRQIDYIFQFSPAAEGDKPPSGPPAKLTWDIPTEIAEVVVPFSLSDLPVP